MNHVANIASIVLVIVGLAVFSKAVANDLALYTIESACATQYVESGYERAEVETGNGTCWIKGSK